MRGLDAKLEAAGVPPDAAPSEAFRLLHAAIGELATVLDRYELEARARGVDASAVSLEERMELAHEVLRLRGYEVMGPPSGAIVEVVDYDPVWRGRFNWWRGRLRGLLGEVALSIDHMGSTAVPGLAAKPIIDIAVAVPAVADEEAYAAPIESTGVKLRSRDAVHRYFRPDAEPRAVQIHVADSSSSWRCEHLLFRDYLRAHAEVALDYGNLKKRLAADHRHDRVAYTDMKGDFIRAAMADARQWADGIGWQAS